MMPFFERLSRIPLYQRILILLVLLALIGVGFYFLFYQPKTTEIKKLSAKRDALQADLTTLRALSSKLDILKERNAQLTEELLEAEAKLPRTKEIPTLLATIAILGDRNSLVFETFAPGNMTQKEFYGEIPLTFRVKGPYHQVVTFFDQIARLPRIIGYRTIKMGQSEIEGDYTFIAASCQAVTYVFLEGVAGQGVAGQGGAGQGGAGK